MTLGTDENDGLGAGQSVVGGDGDRPPVAGEHRRCRLRGSRPRLLSGFARGMITLVVALIRNEGLPPSAFIPEPWPDRQLELAPPVKRMGWTVPKGQVLA